MLMGASMASTIPVLRHPFPLAATPTDLYVVPALASAVCSSISICNQSPNPTSFRVSVRVSGAVSSTHQFIYYDVAIAGNATFIATVGITLSAGDIVTVYATLGTLSFNLFGSEES